MSAVAAIAIGTNLGDRAAAVAGAIHALARLPSSTLLAASAPIETQAEPFPGTDPGGPYLNAAAILRTDLPPEAVLDELLRIERAAGRDRSREPRWGPRVLDLDLLLHGDTVMATPRLTLPHPRMHERLFVLSPLASIAPDLVVPGLLATVRDLERRLLIDHLPEPTK